MSSIALASASPRRRELLSQLGVDFIVVQAPIDESVLPGEQAATYVRRLAVAKAAAGFQAQISPDQRQPLPTLGADTIVVVDGQILGKPVDQADFIRMMHLLRDRCHQVYTAVALHSATLQHDVIVSTDVWFGPLSERQIEAYWHSGEPADKAGGYGIQGLGGRFIEKIHGSYFAVVGLPLYETAALLELLSAEAK
jgi:septum formation protein